MSPSPTIVLQNIELTYQQEIIFSKLNLTITANKITCLLGKSGVGKSTFLRLIAGLISPSTGSVTGDNNQPIAHQVAFMAQTDLLMPWASALENALLGLRLRGEVSNQHIARARELFQQVGLSDAENKFPHELSGGMRQRVALIRTLMEDKPIILMDEPFSAVDAITRFQLQNLVVPFLKNRTVILVTHDPLEALRLADDIYVLQGTPATISLAAQLDANQPRELNDPDVVKKQTELFHVLTEGVNA